MRFGNTSTFNPLFSEGANNAIQALLPRNIKAGDVAFPPRQEWNESLRVGGTESLHDWFRRIIGPPDSSDVRIEQCAIRDDLAFFGRVIWDSKGISYCGLQALVTPGSSLLDFYLAEPDTIQSFKANYYRLDLALKEPGPIFKEAMPHIHCVPDGPPRFPFVYSDEYLPVSFLEFIYLNHFHEDWVKWAGLEVSKRGGIIPFEGIVAGYKSGSIVAQINEFRPFLSQLKKLLFDAKRARVPNAPKVNPCMHYLNYHFVDAIESTSGSGT